MKIKKIKKEKIRRYICVILSIFFVLSIKSNPVHAAAVEPDIDITEQIQDIYHIRSDSVVLMDGDTGQVLFEKNMNMKMYPASITKIMTALIALEKGNLRDTVTMSYDAVWTIGRDTSHIALDEGEMLTLEGALYALSIESANDASNGIAELIAGNMDDFAKQMTNRAKELGATNTNFTNAHGLHDISHYTTAHDMALIMAAAVRIPEFTKIFTAITYSMPPTNRQPETRTFNRKNSLLEGRYKYEGVIGEKTGWTGDSGFTYVAAARRNGRTLIVAVMRSPDTASRWQDSRILFDYGFSEFIPVSFIAQEFSKEQYAVEFTGGVSENMRLVPSQDFTCLVPKSLAKEDIDVNYSFVTDDMTGRILGKAVFSIKSGKSGAAFPELGKVDLQIDLNETVDEQQIPLNNSIITGNQQTAETEEKNPVISVLYVIYKIISVILQIIGAVTVVFLILYLRKHLILQKRKKQRQMFDYNRNMYK